jgi:endoglucanase
MKLRKMIFNFSLISGLIAGLWSCKSADPDCLNPSGFAIQRGVNLSHWLSQDFGWVPKYSLINEDDIRFIDSIGYDHVRIPLDEFELWDSTGAQIPAAFEQLTNCLDWCAKYKLRAIVDMHIIRAHHFNAENEGGSNTLWTNAKAQENFVNLWVQLSSKLNHYPNDMVAYEVLNEAVAPEHDDWNKLMNKAITAIRTLEPNRVLVLGANMWQIAPNLKYLKLPEGDKNIILSFHTYSPMAFTHFKASWVPMKEYQGQVHYPGQIITNEDYSKYIDTTNIPLVNVVADARDHYNKQRLIQVFKEGVDFAKSKNLQLYCGEFGCLPTVERKDRLQYYSDMIQTLEENNVAWCNWEYKGDFGIYFFDLENLTSPKPDVELINVLLQFHKYR